MRSRLAVILFSVLIGSSLLLAQSKSTKLPRVEPTKPPAEVTHTDVSDYLKDQFGDGLSLTPGFSLMKGDLDGDGNEDAVMVVNGMNPLTNEARGGYIVIDPYDGYWGWSDPKMTMSFPKTDVAKPNFVAVVHGWKLEKPVAKYVIVNLPFKIIAMGSFKVKKNVVSAIVTEETDGVNAAVYFDGKKYKWVPFGSN
jgi:hypothetical protein